MAIFGACCEDVDWPIFGTASVDTTAGHFRAGISRCGFSVPSVAAFVKSLPFAAGAVTSMQLSAQIYNGANIPNTSSQFLAFGLSGTNKCLGIGNDASNGSKLCIYKYDGTTRTQLAAEGGASFSTLGIQRLDMQVTNYGASATVNVYINGVSIISFTGDVTVSGMTNFDSVFLPTHTTFASGVLIYSEVFYCDSSSLAIVALQDLALTGPGTTTGWTNNTYTNINGTTLSDLNPTSNNATASQQYTVTTPTPVVYGVAAVQISARMAKSTGSTPTQVKLGYGSGGTGYFGTGAAKTVTTGYQTYIQVDTVNPITGLAFTQSDIASLQFDLTAA
jgi:hypothetical protein